MRGPWLSVLTAIVLLGACARTLPPERSTSRLYRDLERLVTVESAAGWQIDRIEVRGLLAEALMSVCQVPEDERRALLRWIDGRIAELGGPVEEAYAGRDRDLGAVRDLLRLTRIRMTLKASMSAAGSDCPFWLEPSSRFAGRQISDDRWQLTFGSGGKAVLVYRGDQADVHAGGSGRALIGRNFGDRWAVYTGIEGGGSASFPRNEEGQRTKLVLGGDVVLPVVLRYRLVNTYVEGEVGYMSRATEDDISDLEPGLHVGVAVGGRATRRRWFFPGAALAISYKRTFPDGPDLQLQSIEIGVRVAIDMDLW